MQQTSKLELWGGLEYTINRVNDEYFDQLSCSGHYDRPEDIDLIIASGIKTIRYPILWEKHQPSLLAPIDWTVTANNLERLRNAGITVIAGLVHHGSGPEYVNFFDDTFEEGLQAYATAVALRFPWIQFYTPVNEPLTTARFCGLYGHWYPHGKNDACFSRILVSECTAVVKAMMAIRKVNPTAKLVQTEDLAKVYSTPALQYQADFENERRWLSFDLISGKVIPSHPLWMYLMDAGIKTADLEFLSRQAMQPDIFGLNYYITSERFLDENISMYPSTSHGGNAFQQYADVEAVRVNIPARKSPEALIREAWERYGWTIALTEVHLQCTRDEQMRWLYDMWKTALKLREENVPVIAVTAWALFGSFGWNNLLREKGGQYESGAYSIRNNRPEPTALLKLIKALLTGREVKHPVLETPGWWHKPERILYCPPESLCVSFHGEYIGTMMPVQ
jgi:dTDP-4-dehydrorhamnose reductase